MTVFAVGVAFACAMAPILVCIAAGAAIGRGRSRWPGADMLVGLGLAGGALTIVAVLTRLPLSWAMLGIGILAVLSPLTRRALPGGRATWIALALMLPVLLRAAMSEAVLWDDFWQWLPNAAYAYAHDSLAWPDLPPSVSRWPGYPPSMPLMIAGASFVAGRFVETAGPVINVALLAGFGAVLADAVTAMLVRQGRLGAMQPPVAAIGLAVALVVVLNPGLDGEVLLSSYADVGTMIAVGALGLLGVEILSRLSGRSAADPAEMAWRFGFVGAALVNLKQANPVLLALVTAGLAVVALRDPAIATRRALAQLPRMLAPAIVLFAVWRWYLVRNPSVEQTFRPLAEWSFDVLPALFFSIRWNITDVPLFHALMWLVTAAGLAALLSRRGGEAGSLAVVAATVWLGYNAFLLLVYLGAMSRDDAMMAADYWRYAPHVALLALSVPVMALAALRRPSWLRLRSAIPALIALALALSALAVRSDLRTDTKPWPHFVRRITAELEQIIPPGSKLVLVLTYSYSPYQVIVPYDLSQLAQPERAVDLVLWFPHQLETVSGPLARPEGSYLLIHDRDQAMDDLAARAGVPPPHGEIVLYAARNGAWEKVKSWPIPLPLFERPMS
jgi:hypothetical protein